MKFVGKDLDIFVFTHNRAKLLEQTIKNLLRQTEHGIRISILDNASTDNTFDVASQFKSRGVFYYRGDVNGGWQGNLERAKLLASRPWTMLFHDDDLLHPNYCEWALEQISKHKDVSLLGSAVAFDPMPNDSWLLNAEHEALPILCDSEKDLAGILYSGFPLGFCSVIYKTSLLKQSYLDVKNFGKVADRPFLLDILRNGKSIIFTQPLVKYRVHQLQDSNAQDSGPFVNELAALHAFYFKILGWNLFSSCGRNFLFNHYRLLKGEYINLSSKDREIFITYRDYVLFVEHYLGAPSLMWWIAKVAYLLDCLLIRRMYAYVKSITIKNFFSKFERR